VVVTCHANSTYTICKLYGLVYCVPYAGKRFKLFKMRIKFTKLKDVDPEDESNDRDQDNDLEEAQD
jgi:hypothetical protein